MAQRFSGTKLRAIREDRGYAREWLAVAVHRSHNSIFLYEHGKATPPVVVLERAAEALGCNVSDFFVEVADAHAA